VIDAGRVGRPHGLDGSFYVTRVAGDVFTVDSEVEVGDRRTRVERRAGTAERPILRLEGCATREDAEALRGETLRVSEDAVPPLEEDEYWAHELEGSEVHDGARAVGTVRRMVTLPSCEALEVERAEGGEVLIPLVRDAVRSIDREARRIDVDMRFVEG
jgi:16S rRNA processing protein RimM